MSKFKRFRVTCERYSGAPSKDEFAKMFIDGIHHAGMSGDIHYDAEEFRLCIEDWIALELRNAYREYCLATSENRTKVLQHWVRAWCRSKIPIPADFENARHDLFPLVVERVFHDVDNLRMELEGDQSSDWPYEIIGEHLAVGLVYDLPETMLWIRQETLDKWGVTFVEAMKVATENLKQLPHVVNNPEPGVYVFDNHDDYDASRLLLPGVIRQLPVKGNPIAIAPARNMLVVTGSDDMDRLKCMLAKTQDALRRQMCQSSHCN